MLRNNGLVSHVLPIIRVRPENRKFAEPETRNFPHSYEEFRYSLY